MKSLKIAVVLLVLIMSVGTACAADVFDVTDNYNQNILETAQDGVSAVDEPKTFTDLKNDILNSESVFEMTNDYRFNNESDNIGFIDVGMDNFVINGNGHTIDADSQSSIFSISARNVTVNNLTLMNANYILSSVFYIKNTNCSLTTNNVNFINDTSAQLGIIRVMGTYVSNNDRFMDCTSSGVLTAVNSMPNESIGLEINNAVVSGLNMSDWGFIYAEYSNVNIAILNSTFMNLTSDYSTAVKGTTRTIIKNSKFINLYSRISAGAIAVKNAEKTLIDNCTFINVTSMKNGGVLVADVSGDSQMTGNVEIINSDFVSCHSGIGGAVMQLSGNLTVNNCTFSNNSVAYDGGAIYLSHVNADISNSSFNENHALYNGSRGTFGGAIFNDMTTLNLINCELAHNTAQYGSAVYGYDSSYNISYNKFTDNRMLNGSFNDIFTEFDCSSFLENNEYSADASCDLNNTNYNTIMVNGGNKLVLINNTIDVTTIPSRFDLREWGWSTPVKDQGRMGSCWTFGSSGAMESAILRYLGIEMNISENNIEDMSLQYNKYGVNGNIEAADSKTAAAYALSWFGVFSTENDPYDQTGKVSLIIAPNNSIHFQDVAFIPPRNNVTDNDLLKKAILKYGALAVTYAADQTPPYLNPETSAQYNNESEAGDHCVTLIGWDDSYSADNFLITPPGDGAWIIKNSWGPQNGDQGYYYISYYDVNFVTSYPAIAYLLENTVEYNKNYQYDILGDLTFGTDINEYVNEYAAISNDMIAGVGTYFYDADVEYTVEVYINNALKYSQTGVSPFAGFHTIQLDSFIPVKKGDVFAVKIKSNALPVLVHSRQHYIKGTSKYLENGTWVDASDDGIVCCIKVYTVDSPIYTEDLVKIYKNDSRFEAGIDAANETVTFEINGMNYTRTSDENGTASMAINLNPGNYTIKTTFNGTTVENKITVLPTLIAEDLVKYCRNESQFFISLIDGEGKSVSGVNITMNINGVFYNRTTNENGTAKLNINLEPGEYILTAIDPLTGLQMSYNITVLPVLFAKDLEMRFQDGSTFNALVLNGQGNPLTNAAVTFNINGVFYTRYTNSSGMAKLNINLMAGEYIITSEFDGMRISNTITIRD